MKYVNNQGEVYEGEFDITILRHTTAHILAQAIKRLFPDAKLAIGPAIENGFYYDVDNITLKNEDLEKLEAEMKKIIKENLKIESFSLPREEAIQLMKEKEESYKVELIEDLPEDTSLTFFKQGEFTDLCVGPHLLYTKGVKAFKLLNITGAYWRGDEKNKMLTRIYGTAFATKEDLADYLTMLEEARKRDHRKIGKELELFFFDETAPGMPYWLPKGLKLFNTLIDFWRNEHEKRGYQEFSAPQLNNSVLWKTSGHWDHYKEDMFVLEDADGMEQALKPMSCPNAIRVYQQKRRSYKDLPLRFNDVDVIHRNEKSGQLNGLFRVRMFRQDDSHNFVTEAQIADEIKDILKIADKFYGVFGLSFVPSLSTRPDDFMGDIAVWDRAEEQLKSVLNEMYGEGGYAIKEKDGAFYGPKIDIQMKDSLGRQWQMGTIQLDFQLPLRFDLSYIDHDGNKQIPIIIHRVIYGSLERFIGLLIEHFAGAFPLWIAPEQVRILPISEHQVTYAKQVQQTLQQAGYRVQVDTSDEKLGYKIRATWANKVPYMIILGQKEMEDQKVSIRSLKGEQLDELELTAFMEKMKQEIDTSMNVE